MLATLRLATHSRCILPLGLKHWKSVLPSHLYYVISRPKISLKRSRCEPAVAIRAMQITNAWAETIPEEAILRTPVMGAVIKRAVAPPTPPDQTIDPHQDLNSLDHPAAVVAPMDLPKSVVAAVARVVAAPVEVVLAKDHLLAVAKNVEAVAAQQATAPVEISLVAAARVVVLVDRKNLEHVEKIVRIAISQKPKEISKATAVRCA